MAITDQAQANAYLEELIKERQLWTGKTAIECAQIEQGNLAAYATNFPVAVRLRVQVLFRSFMPGIVLTQEDVDREEVQQRFWKEYLAERERNRVEKQQEAFMEAQREIETTRRRSESQARRKAKKIIKVEPTKKGRVFDLE